MFFSASASFRPLLVRLAPGIVDQDHPGLFVAVFLDRVVDQRLVDQHVDRRDAEHIVLCRAIAGDRRARRPHAHERYLALVRERHDRDRDRRVEAAEQAGDLLALHELAGRDCAFGRITLVIAHQQLDLLAEHAALGVDLVDCDREAAHDRLARFGGLAGHGGDQAELQGVLRECRNGKQGRRRRGQEETSREMRKAGSRGHGVSSLRVKYPDLGFARDMPARTGLQSLGMRSRPSFLTRKWAAPPRVEPIVGTIVYAFSRAPMQLAWQGLCTSPS